MTKMDGIFPIKKAHKVRLLKSVFSIYVKANLTTRRLSNHIIIPEHCYYAYESVLLFGSNTGAVFTDYLDMRDQKMAGRGQKRRDNGVFHRFFKSVR